MLTRTPSELPACGVVISPSFRPILDTAGLRRLEDFFAAELPGERLTKPGLGHRQRWRLTLHDADGSARTVYLKRFVPPPIRQQLRRLLGPGRRCSTGGWEWTAIHRLAAAGIPTMTPLAVGQEMLGGCWERRSFVVTDAVGGEALERWLPVHLAGDLDARRALRRRLVDAVADLVRRFHAAGFCHRDLYTSHVFVAVEPELRLWLIDLQRVFSPRWRRGRWRIKDLAELHFSTPAGCVPATDRVRFLKRYLGIDRLDARAKRLARRVAAKARRIARHDLRRRRRQP